MRYLHPCSLTFHQALGIKMGQQAYSDRFPGGGKRSGLVLGGGGNNRKGRGKDKGQKVGCC